MMPRRAYPRRCEPTAALVREVARREFDQDSDTALTDAALSALLHQFPHNINCDQVLLKVAAINLLYSARLETIYLHNVAKCITDLSIDDRLRSSSPDLRLVGDLVHAIQPYTGKENYSFATKYCSWHNQAAYPIHDGNVDVCLWVYKLQFHFADFKRCELRDYERFHSILCAFQKHFRLEDIGTKELDKFLWVTGDEILNFQKEE